MKFSHLICAALAVAFIGSVSAQVNRPKPPDSTSNNRAVNNFIYPAVPPTCAAGSLYSGGSCLPITSYLPPTPSTSGNLCGFAVAYPESTNAPQTNVACQGYPVIAGDRSSYYGYHGYCPAGMQAQEIDRVMRATDPGAFAIDKIIYSCITL